ncbi:hypothetical protein MXD81_43225 [Microbacteriaceae bacterium K1510]|nr:hypothetical protein [Microbacteriaceae bacterium K1510]
MTLEISPSDRERLQAEGLQSMEINDTKKQGETAGRYGDRFNICLKVDAISKLPVLTNHLPVRALTLLPPVALQQPVRRPRRLRPKKLPNV